MSDVAGPIEREVFMPVPTQIFAERSFLGQSTSAFDELIQGDAVILGAGHAIPYPDHNETGDTASATAPGAICKAANIDASLVDHYDFDLGGPLMRTVCGVLWMRAIWTSRQMIARKTAAGSKSPWPRFWRMGVFRSCLSVMTAYRSRFFRHPRAD